MGNSLYNLLSSLFEKDKISNKEGVGTFEAVK